MANIGEAHITRLNRERLAAINKFLPVRDSFRDNLQAQQQQRIAFTADTEQLFKPRTTATEKVETAIEESKPEVKTPVVKEIYDEKLEKLRNKFTDEALAHIVGYYMDDFKTKYWRKFSQQRCIFKIRTKTIF